MVMDLYDKAISYLHDNPDKVQEVWDDPKSHFSGILFQSVTPSGYSEENSDGLFCGDICEIRSFLAHAWTETLEEQINADPRIPKLYANNDFLPKMSIDTLKVFAEWQRKIDVELNRKPENFVVVD